MDNEKEKMYNKLVDCLIHMGYPRRFGELIAMNLGTEKTMERMLVYLRRNQPSSAEEIADEMLAIKDEFEGYRKKKEAEYYNASYNSILNDPLFGDEDEI